MQRISTPLPTRYYVDAVGAYLGGYGGFRVITLDPETLEPIVSDEMAEVPAGAIEVPTNPPVIDWTWDGEQWVAPPPPPPPTLEERKAALMDAVRARRKEVEQGGIEVGGFPVRTDESSQSKIDNAIKLLEEDPTLPYIDWEGLPGVWAQVDLATLKAIGLAVGRHVQACFSYSRTLWEAIEAAEDDAALDAIDIAAGWPPGG